MKGLAVFVMGLAGMASTGENFGWGGLGGASWCGAGRARSAARAMARDGFFCQEVFCTPLALRKQALLSLSGALSGAFARSGNRDLAREI